MTKPTERRGGLGSDETTYLKVKMPKRLKDELQVYADRHKTLSSRVVRAAIEAYIGVNPMAEPAPLTEREQ